MKGEDDMAYSNICSCSANGSTGCSKGCARCNNGCRSSYGVLNAVPSCADYRNYPFYTGNCPNACGYYGCGCCAGVTGPNGALGGCLNENCGCGGCTGCSGCNQNCNRPVYGLFSANAPVTVAAGAAIPLVTTSISSDDFSVTNGVVTFSRCGVYLATYTVHVPTGSEVDTNIVMNVNGVAQTNTLLNVSAAGSYTGQTVFTANVGSVLSLVSSAALSITEPAGQNVVTLTLTRIG